MSSPETPAALSLPAELTIYQVGELHTQWLAWLRGQAAAADGATRVDAQAVNEVDSAGLQLLVSLQRTLADRGSALQLHAPSHALRNAAEALGLWECLSAAPPGAAA